MLGEEPIAVSALQIWALEVRVLMVRLLEVTLIISGLEVTLIISRLEVRAIEIRVQEVMGIEFKVLNVRRIYRGQGAGDAMVLDFTSSAVKI